MCRLLPAAALLACVGCGGDDFHAVYPVTGVVTVDGEPADGCQVWLYRTFDDDHPRRVAPYGVCDAAGRFAVNSYSVGDGAPAGEYVLTVEWKMRSGVLGQNLDGPDQLAGAFADREANRKRPGFVLTVGKGPLEVPPLALTLTPEQRKKRDDIRARAKARGAMMGGG
jgi:hypothetical protein